MPGGHVQDRPHSRDHGTPDNGSDTCWDIDRDGYNSVTRYHGPLCETGHAKEMVDLLVAAVQAARAVHQPPGRGLHPAVHAHHRSTRHAVLALSTPWAPSEDNAVTRHDVSYRGTYLLDHPRSLVAEHHR